MHCRIVIVQVKMSSLGCLKGHQSAPISDFSRGRIKVASLSIPDITNESIQQNETFYTFYVQAFPPQQNTESPTKSSSKRKGSKKKKSASSASDNLDTNYDVDGFVKLHSLSHVA